MVRSPNSFEELTCYDDEGPCKDLGISKQTLKVYFLPCPVGFKLSPKSTSSCDCDPDLQPYVRNYSISTTSVLRQGEFWISPVQLNSTISSGYIIYPHCLFDYCHPPNEALFINLNSTDGVDGQRSFSRSGSCVENANLISGSHPWR